MIGWIRFKTNGQEKQGENAGGLKSEKRIEERKATEVLHPAIWI